MSLESLQPINYLGHIFPPELAPIAPDSERYHTNKTSLIPHGQKEDRLSKRELYEHLSITVAGIQKKTDNPDVPAYRVYDILYQASDYVTESDGQLAVLSTVYNEGKYFFESPDQIRNNSAVEGLLAEYLLAVESFKIKNWYIEDDDEYSHRLEEIKDYVRTRKSRELVHLCSKVTKMIKDRRDFWKTELATVITHPIVDDVNRAIAESHDPEELEIAE